MLCLFACLSVGFCRYQQLTEESISPCVDQPRGLSSAAGYMMLMCTVSSAAENRLLVDLIPPLGGFFILDFDPKVVLCTRQSSGLQVHIPSPLKATAALLKR